MKKKTQSFLLTWSVDHDEHFSFGLDKLIERVVVQKVNVLVALNIEPLVFLVSLGSIRIIRIGHELDEVFGLATTLVSSLILAEVEVDYCWKSIMK